MATQAEQVHKQDDFARGTVPEGDGSSGLHLAFIIIGGTIGFSVFIVAARIGGSLGYGRAAMAFILGSLVLGIMGAATSYVGARSRLSTYLLTEFAFGREGAKFANIAVVLSLIGWYGVISNFLGQAGQQMLLESFGINISPYIGVLIASGLMIFVTVRGFTGIDKLALYLVPVMSAFILYAAYQSMMQSSEQIELTNDFTFQTAVSAVVGSYVAGVIIQPDYSRFARSNQAAIWSVFIALGIVFPLVQFLSAIPSLTAGDPDLLKVMATLGLAIPAFFLLTLGAWSSNVLCLYSSGLSIATMTSKVSLQQIILTCGVVGTAVAFVPAQSYLVDFLVVLGVVIPPIGAIYVVEAFYMRGFEFDLESLRSEKPFNIMTLAIWLSASIFGFMSENGIIQITGISSIDSLIVAVAGYCANIYLINGRKRRQRPDNR